MAVMMIGGFDVMVERDVEGFYVASAPALPGCHTQATTLEELTVRIREAIGLCLEQASGEKRERAIDNDTFRKVTEDLFREHDELFRRLAK